MERVPIVEAALIITQHEQAFKAEIVQIQYKLSELQTALKTVEDAISEGQSDIARLELELRNLELREKEVEARGNTLDALLPMTESQANKAQDDADAIIQSLDERLVITQKRKDTLVARGVCPLQFQDGILEKLREKVIPPLSRLEELEKETEVVKADCDAESSRQRSLIEMSQRLSDVTNAIAQKQVYIQTQRDRNAKYSLNTHPRVNTVRRPAVHFETELKRINDSADIKEALQEVMRNLQDLCIDTPVLCSVWRRVQHSLRLAKESGDPSLLMCVLCTHKQFIEERLPSEGGRGEEEDAKSPSLASPEVDEDESPGHGENGDERDITHLPQIRKTLDPSEDALPISDASTKSKLGGRADDEQGENKKNEGVERMAEHRNSDNVEVMSDMSSESDDPQPTTPPPPPTKKRRKVK